MNDLQSYISRARDPEKKERLATQWHGAACHGEITCGCGQLRALELAYRCLYCGEFFCVSCAEKHFGKTIFEHIQEKRIERRQELARAKVPAFGPCRSCGDTNPLGVRELGMEEQNL